MNWKRIFSGSAAAAFIVAGGELISNKIYAIILSVQNAGAAVPAGPWRLYLGVPLLVLKSLVTGFVLMFLYAMARPRLGPGPKTALSMGSMVWILIGTTAGAADWFWWRAPAHLVGGILFVRWVECLAGIYVAGWQYIEKAP